MTNVEAEKIESKSMTDTPTLENTGLRSKLKHMSAEDEKSNVLEVISDLEKQLDIVFNVKDNIEKELSSSKQELKNTMSRFVELEGKVESLEMTLKSKEGLETQLQFFKSSCIEAEEKRNELADKLVRAEAELRKKIAELDETKNSLEQANASLGEIRQMLTNTRDNAKKRYYTKL